MSDVTLGIDSLLASIYNDVKHLCASAAAEVKTLLDKDFKQYLTASDARYSKIKSLLHTFSPVYFYDIYQPLSVELQSRSRLLELQSAEEIFSEGKQFTLFGSAGCGKSTFLKHLFFETIISQRLIPIYIELRNVEIKNFNIYEIIKSEINTPQMKDEILEHLFQNDKIVLFIDGYDEIDSTGKEYFLTKISKLVKQFSDIRIIIASRPGTGIKFHSLFKSLEILPFNFEQSIDFTRKQLNVMNLADKEQLLAAIKNAYYDELLTDYLSNPLLLSIYIITMEYNSDAPKNRIEFYERVIDALFFKHDQASKIAFHRSFRTGLDRSTLKQVIRKFCFITHFKSEYRFSVSKVESRISKCYTPQNDQFDHRSFIEDMETSLCLFAEQRGKYEFAHRSLHEYLACRYINLMPSAKKKSFYDEIFSSKLLSNESSNYELTRDFLMEIEEVDYLDLFDRNNLMHLKKHLSKFSYKNYAPNKFIKSFIILSKDALFSFNKFAYAIIRYQVHPLCSYIEKMFSFSLSDNVREWTEKKISERRKTFPKIIDYITTNIDDIELYDSIENSINSIEEKISKIERVIKNITKENDILVKLLRD